MTFAALTWFLSLFAGFYAAQAAFENLPRKIRESKGQGIRAAETLFHELEETLSTGLVPADERWLALKRLEAPWNTLSYDCLTLLRSEGAAVVPTLKRFRELARRHFESLQEARARSAQAIAQACVCGSLAPLFAVLLRFLLPEVEASGGIWWGATGVALLMGVVSGAWIWKMAEGARWGGLKLSERTWMLDSLVFGERFLALLRLGRAPDRAWTESVPLLPAELLLEWVADPWKTTTGSTDLVAKNLRQALIQTGIGYKKSMQASLWDGQPCSERIESVISATRAEVRAFQERELQLLPTRALKPLFLLTAPGILALLGFALYLSVSSSLETL
ncbi:MAG: hypothetical protein H7301_11325 [Cryobacterium sp.]|nr:hypothetical protein [Oligoflexia bacterium]